MEVGAEREPDRRPASEFTGPMEANLAVLTAEVEAAERYVDDLGDQLRQAVRRLHDLRGRRESLAAVSATDVERDIALLERLPNVVSVEAADDRVSITTNSLIVDHEGTRYDLGRFQIDLSPSAGVRVWAIEKPPTDVAWEHPHVQAGRPCLGGARVGVEKLLGTYQYLAAGEVILRLLTSFDVETAYCRIDHWPVVA